jgi:hypothetical protein
LETLLDVFIGKKADVTIDFYGKTITLKGTVTGYWKPFLFIKVNGITRALNESIIREIIPIGDAT